MAISRILSIACACRDNYVSRGNVAISLERFFCVQKNTNTILHTGKNLAVSLVRHRTHYLREVRFSFEKSRFCSHLACCHEWVLPTTLLLCKHKVCSDFPHVYQIWPRAIIHHTTPCTIANKGSLAYLKSASSGTFIPVRMFSSATVPAGSSNT